MQKKQSNILYGFDDYDIVSLYSGILYANHLDYWDLNTYRLGNGGTIWYPIQTEYKESRYSYPIPNIKDNKAVLDTANTLFIHPSCTISRTLVNQKYKKSLDPWSADAVVFPSNSENMVSCDSRTAVFINNNAKLIVVFLYTGDQSIHDSLKSIPHGTKLRDIMKSSAVNDMLSKKIDDYHAPYVLNAELDFVGCLINFNSKTKYVLDYFTDAVPKDKIVFESSVLESLSNNDNAITFDNLVSIYEMLSSKDNDVVGTGIRTLSTMDYINCPNSVKLVLNHASEWRYNDASKSTIAKYMFKYLLGGTARSSVQFHDEYISQRDYDILNKLLDYFYKGDQQRCYDSLSYMPFVYRDDELQICPRIIDR